MHRKHNGLCCDIQSDVAVLRIAIQCLGFLDFRDIQRVKILNWFEVTAAVFDSGLVIREMAIETLNDRFGLEVFAWKKKHSYCDQTIGVLVVIVDYRDSQ